jgi:hypothetical protein
MRAILALADGMYFAGESFGSPGEAMGEVVFNTSMMGYQEILTDPSYKGQIVTMTYPLIGNYGVNEEDFESHIPWVEGFIVKECEIVVSKSVQRSLRFLRLWHCRHCWYDTCRHATCVIMGPRRHYRPGDRPKSPRRTGQTLPDRVD